MKKITILLLLISSTMISQIHTEVYLFDIEQKNDKWEVTNGENISKNLGYDNQPHFYNDTTLIFVSTRKKQTDIVKYNTNTKKKYFLNNSINGSEYSPQRIPESNTISAVRLDDDGLQRFYEYDEVTQKNKTLIKNLVIAYPFWYDKNTLISSVIVNDTLELFISDLKKKTNTSITKETGRSIHKIPNSDLISFIKKGQKGWQIWSLNPISKEIKKITEINKMQDMCWLPNGNLLLSNKKNIIQFSPSNNSWTYFYQFKDENINNISRIIVNKKGTKLALVAENSPKILAQQQLEAYNKRDINAFLKPYAKNVKIYTFPNELNYEGIDEMRKRYTPMFKNTADLHCEIVSRIVKGNTIIDEELVTANGSTFKAVAIYTIKNNKISEVRFLR